jgi:hypothetical protein
VDSNENSRSSPALHFGSTPWRLIDSGQTGSTNGPYTIDRKKLCGEKKMTHRRLRRRTESWTGICLVTIVLLVGGFSFAGVGAAHTARAFVGTGVAVAPSANPPLTINGLSVNPNPATQGSQFSVSVQVSGGLSPYNYNWNSVPGTCPAPGNSPSWQCSISSPGQYSVGVIVTDSGVNHTSASQSFTVSSNGGSGGGGGGSGSSKDNGSNGFNLSSFGPLLIYGLIAGIVGFVLLVALTVGVIMIAVILSRRLPHQPRGRLVCGKCGTRAPAGSKFCPACASPIAPPEKG